MTTIDDIERRKQHEKENKMFEDWHAEAIGWPDSAKRCLAFAMTTTALKREIGRIKRELDAETVRLRARGFWARVWNR